MKNKLFPALLCLSVIACGAIHAQSQAQLVNRNAGRHTAGGQVVTPLSGIAKPGDAGVRSHTMFKIFVPPGRPAGLVGFSSPRVEPASDYNGETPASLACVYGLVAWTPGCNPATLSNLQDAIGGARAIAIVDAYHYPTAAADLQAYSTEFGLPTIKTTGTGINFTVIYQTNAKPPTPDPACASAGGWNCWAAEAALDLEMVHAMAPHAHIYLVEANSDLDSDLYAAVKEAASVVYTLGGGEVSMSWGEPEYPDEASFDSTFVRPRVVFLAAAGDSEGLSYPATSPNVVGAGGTTLSRNPYTGDIEGEYSWEDSGGGYSQYEPAPAFQNSISDLAEGARAIPDVSAVANPRTPVWVYDSYQTANQGVSGSWNLFGGTSVSTQLWAGIMNRAGHFAASTNDEELLLYANDPLSPNIRDIVSGNCGYYDGWNAIQGWDPCTGVGAPYGTGGK